MREFGSKKINYNTIIQVLHNQLLSIIINYHELLLIYPI